jgi:hypothetical protein
MEGFMRVTIEHNARLFGFFGTFFSKAYGWLAIFFFIGIGFLLYGIYIEPGGKKATKIMYPSRTFLSPL